MRILALDVGNSFCHGAVAEDGRIVGRASWPVGEAVPDASVFGVSLEVEAAVYASVRAGGEARIASWARKGNVPLRGVPSDIPYPIPVKQAHPERTGPDRVLCAAAALAQVGGPVLVVDAGTAVTVDRADPREGFLGGAILPGLSLMARSLARETSRLPFVPPGPVEDPLGRSTEEAIRAGVVWGWRGAVKEVVERLGAGWAGTLVITGGDAERLRDVFGGRGRWVPDLALTGIALSWERANENRTGR